MCGAESEAIEPRKISGSVLQLCSNCAGLGEEPTYRDSIGHRAYVAQTLEKRKQKTRYKEIETDDVLIGNLGSVVRRAREKMNLDHATLASKISEKKSILTSVEAGNMSPNEKLTKKLENFLKIKLTEKVEAVELLTSKSSGESLTMGDLIKQAMEKE
jgi:putative transcription factor|tara:strand:+ start:62 stop:535 length:474 start_codon:yes stop_codon:yes gene_type:complete